MAKLPARNGSFNHGTLPHSNKRQGGNEGMKWDKQMLDITGKPPNSVVKKRTGWKNWMGRRAVIMC